MLQTLCVPCANRCRYCLLSANGKANGADWDRSAALAKSFQKRLAETRPELGFNFSFGYSMEHPKLLEAIDFMNAISSVGGSFLQFDGMNMRSDAELDELFCSLKAHDVEKLSFTFYGTEVYHDRFAAREGDFDLMLRSIRSALKAGLAVGARMPLTSESIGMAEELYGVLRGIGDVDLRMFIPHGEGRGALIEPIRLKQSEFNSLPDEMKSHMDRSFYRTEGDWCRMAERGEAPLGKDRTLIITLTKDNIERMENTPVEDIIAEAEGLDEAYYAAFPSFEELAETLGDRDGERMFSHRDLFHYYRKIYAREHGIEVYDVTDETQTGSRRL